MRSLNRTQEFGKASGKIEVVLRMVAEIKSNEDLLINSASKGEDISEDNDYSEDTLEKSAIQEFKKLDYTHLNCFHEKFGLDGKGTLGRKTKSEVLLFRRLREAIKKLNPEICAEAEEYAIQELAKDRSRLSPVKANQEVHSLIKNGIKVKIRNEKEEIEDQTVKVIDFENPGNNDFFLASQFWVMGEMEPRRTDLLGFVNGIPLIFIELKATGKRVREAFDDNLTDYKETIPQIFWYNAFIILSNGRESKMEPLRADLSILENGKGL